jgi:lysophospholipase L1-like esterase
MWAWIFNKYLKCNELRNYALSGASYKDAERTSGNERQNLSYQINLALADLDNAGGAFVVDHFQPDIIIMAIGTNDGTPNDTPEQAYSKIVTTSSGIDVDATLSALDRSKFCEAVLWANLMIRKYFVDSLYCVVLPIQRMSDDNPIGTLHDYIKEIAQRFGGAIIIDGAYDSGIVKSNNVTGGLGTTLKDGLHPNDVGQIMMARMIMSAVNSHYVDYTNMQ